MKIVFMGTAEFAVPILEKLVQSNYRPALVVASPDKPVGRKQIITPPPVKVLAEKYKIPVAQPEKIGNRKYKPAASLLVIPSELREIGNLTPDLIVVAAYGKILPKEILDIPRFGCLNIHPSLLPKYRGPSPIQTAILNGDKETGVTIILMNERVDSGGIVASSKYQTSSSITYRELLKELAELGAKLLIDTIPKWIKGEIKPRIQDETKATYTKILKKGDGKIDWQKSAKDIEKQIRAFEPWPSSFTKYQTSDKNYKILKILKAQVLKQTKKDPSGPSGKIFLFPGNKIAVQTAKDFLIIEVLLPEGKKPMTAVDFLRGHKGFIGTIIK